MNRVKVLTEDQTADAATRQVTAIANTAAVDLADEIVVPEGAELDARGNPVYFADARTIYYDHSYMNGDPRVLPIGKLRKAQLVRRPSGSAWRCVMYITDKTSLARDVFSLMQEGIIRGVSVGFEATKYGPLTEDEEAKYGPARSIVRAWKWRELSVTAMPCNPEAWVENIKRAGTPLDIGQQEQVKSLASRGVISRDTVAIMGIKDTRKTIVIV